MQHSTIGFLICHKIPKAYNGNNILFQYLISDVNIEKQSFMPVGIISKKEIPVFYKTNTILIFPLK